ncbi:hypothetical protein LCGC14_1419260, partial [marine sediment metagenome]
MDELRSIGEEFKRELEGVKSTQELDALRVKYLGKKGLITLKLKLLGTAQPEERKTLGKTINDLKVMAEGAIESKKAFLRDMELRQAIEAETLDVTLP